MQDRMTRLDLNASPVDVKPGTRSFPSASASISPPVSPTSTTSMSSDHHPDVDVPAIEHALAVIKDARQRFWLETEPALQVFDQIPAEMNRLKRKLSRRDDSLSARDRNIERLTREVHE